MGSKKGTNQWTKEVIWMGRLQWIYGTQWVTSTGQALTVPLDTAWLITTTITILTTHPPNKALVKKVWCPQILNMSNTHLNQRETVKAIRSNTNCHHSIMEDTDRDLQTAKMVEMQINISCNLQWSNQYKNDFLWFTLSILHFTITTKPTTECHKSSKAM